MSLLSEGPKQFLKLFNSSSASEESTVYHTINIASMLEDLSMHSSRDRLTHIPLAFHFSPQHASVISAPVAWEFKAKSEVPLPESPLLYLSYFPDLHANVASLSLISIKSLRNLLLCHHLFRHSTFTLSRKESKHQRLKRADPLLSISNCI